MRLAGSRVAHKVLLEDRRASIPFLSSALTGGPKNMKESINAIASFLDGDLLELSKQARDRMPDYEHSELKIKEAYPLLKLLIDQLKSAIDKGYIERVSLARRTNIGAHLVNIKSSLDVFRQNDFEANYQSKQYQAQYIQGVYGLKDAVDDAKLFEMSKSYGNYYASLEKLAATENLFQETLSRITEAEKLYQTAYDSLEVLTEKIQSASQATETLEEITTIGIKNEAKIDGLLDSSKLYTQDIEDRRAKVEAFHKNIEIMEVTLQAMKDENTKHIDNSKLSLLSIADLSNRKLDEAVKRSNSIVVDNASLQEQLTELLQGATAGKLYTEFKTESNKIRFELWFWLAGVVLINAILLAFSLIVIFGLTNMGIPPINLNSLSAVAFVKIFLTVPIVLLDWFIVRQYNIRRALMEKYAFKSLVSISLIHYNELVKKHIDNEEVAGFIISAIDKIYSSPFEVGDNKTAAAINALTEKGAGIFEKAVEKVIEKVKA